jgi:hypothetical protein
MKTMSCVNNLSVSNDRTEPLCVTHDTYPTLRKQPALLRLAQPCGYFCAFSCLKGVEAKFLNTIRHYIQELLRSGVPGVTLPLPSVSSTRSACCQAVYKHRLATQVAGSEL